jgi:hypothetical protein
MRFTIIRSESLVIIDNAVATIDVSSLPTNVEIVVYQEIDGKIEYNDRPSLRLPFTDPSPYQSLLNAWITNQATVTPALQLAQAKQVKNDLVEGIFHHKRRLPYAYGAWSYDAHDESVTNLDLLVQATIDTSVLVASINAAFATITSQVNNTVVGGVNDTVVGGVNNTVVGGVNGTVVPGVNAMVAANNNSAAAVNNWSNLSSLNWGRVLIMSTPTLPYNAMSPGNMSGPTGGASGPGTPGAGPGSGGFQNMANIAGIGTIGGIGTIAGATVSGGTGHAGNITHQPLNAAAPQSIPAADISAALQGIANRRNTLNSNRLTKRVAINALTTIAAVVAYDATTGWSF